MTPSTDRIHQLLADGVRDQVYPGAVWAVGDAAGTRASGAVGVLDPAKPDEPMLPDTVFDVASLTKILAVWSTIGSSGRRANSRSTNRSARTGPKCPDTR